MKRIVLLIFLVQSLCLNAQETAMTRGDSLVSMSMTELMGNNPQGALKYAKEALELQEKTYGKDSPQYDMAVSNLALAYSQNKQYDESIRLRMEQFDRYRQKYGGESAESAMVLYMIASCYFMDKKYELSKEYAIQAVDIYTKVKGTGSQEYEMAITSLVYALEGNKEYDRAILYKEEQCKRFETSSGTGSIAYADILLDLCRLYTHNGNTEDAIMSGQQALDIYENDVNSWLKYKFGVLALGNIFLKKKDYDSYIQIKERQLSYYSRLFGDKDALYGDVLIELCTYYPLVGKYDAAIDCGRKALDIFEKVKDDNGFKFDMAAMGLKNIYEKNEDYNSVIAIEERQLAREGDIYGKESLEYASILEDLAFSHSMAENHDNAIKYIDEAIAIIRKSKGEESKEYVNAVANKTNFMKLAGRHDDSKEVSVPVLKTKERLLDAGDADFVKKKYEIAKDYAGYEKYQDAIRIMQEVVSYLTENGCINDEYASALETLAGYYYDADNFSECLELTEKALAVREEQKDNNYAKALSKKSKIESMLGLYTDAIETDEKALEIWEAIDTEESRQYRELVLGSLANSYSSLGNRHKAGLYRKEEYRLMEKRTGEQIPDMVWKDIENDINEGEDLATTNKDVQGALIQLNQELLSDLEYYGMKNTTDYADCLISGFGTTYALMKDYPLAKDKIVQGMKIIEDVMGEDNMSYEAALEILARCQWELGNKDEAIGLLMRALDISNGLLPKNHPNILSLQTRIAICKSLLNSSDAVVYAINATDGLKSLVLSSFAQLTSTERNLYWDKFKEWFQKDLHNIVDKYNGATAICAAYDGVLLSKGLLLNSEMEMNHLIAESGDNNLLNEYYKLKMIRSELNNLKADNSAVLKDSLENIMTEIEKNILRQSKAYGDYTKNLAVDWKQVQSKLGDKDIAIEFVSFPTTRDCIMYVAYCLRKGMKSPKMYPLFETKQLKDVVKKAYESTDVSELVWKPMMEELADVENVYFSPSGELYNIAIESMPDYEEPTRLVSERWNLYRLSSTRELALIKDENNISKSAVYGGLTYNTDATTLINDSKNYATTRNLDFFTLNVADSLNLRAGVMELPQTRVEAQNIDKALAEIKIDNSLYTDTIGTEASFKALSGQKRNLLHIATHGFYWTDTEVKNLKNLSFLMLNNDNRPRYTEDKAMTRSGLLFAGANNVLRGGHLPENVDDGILTAKEISTLDLRGLDLVVLSACQTGLGDITGDGVFGLQRGFKKAGAQTLMMSLWKVDDNATQILMTQFYKNLLGGADKRKAFNDAQRYLRKYDSGRYSEPKYWAAFIMLD